MKNKLSCILLVDDSEPTNFLHKRAINKAECAEKICVAKNGQEALDYLDKCQRGNETTPDMIFLDINMPIMDGWQFLEEYRKLDAEFTKDILLIIMLTTSLNTEDADRAAEKEITEFLNKPLTAEMLEIILKKNFPERF